MLKQPFYIYVGIVLVAGLILLLGFHFLFGRSTKRSSDRKRLRGERKKVYKEALALAEIEPRSAARLLESVQLYREAIDLLEKKGLFHDAANILKRMGRPNRAGALYKRNRLWKDAAICFEKASMLKDAGQMYINAGDYTKAIKLYSICNEHLMVAEYSLEIGNHQESARAYIKAGHDDDAIALYKVVLQNVEDVSSLQFDSYEIEFIKSKFLAGEASPSLAAILVQNGCLEEVIQSLIFQGDIEGASELYMRSTKDIGPKLLAIENMSQQEHQNLAKVFLNVSNFEGAGIIYERNQQFEEAADAFRNAQAWDRAAYCFDRAGNKAMAVEMRCKMEADPDRGPTPSSAKPTSQQPTNPFIIEDTGLRESDAPPAEGQGGFADLEDTAELPADHVPPPPTDPVNIEALPQNPKVIALSDHNKVPPAPTGRHAPAPAPYHGDAARRISSSPLPAPPSTGTNPHIAFLRARFLDDLDPTQKTKMWQISRPGEFQNGEVILDFGSETAGVFFILDGQVGCWRRGPQGEKEVDTVSPGTTLGEFWLLIDRPSEVRFVAKGEVKVQSIDRISFQELLDKEGAIARKLYKKFSQQLVSRLLSKRNN